MWSAASSGREETLQPPSEPPQAAYAGGVVESAHSGRWIVTPVRQWRYRGRSRYQRIDIGEVDHLGTCLFIDGWLQLAAADEHVYHEHLVLPALLAHGRPERVLILGGGDALAAREVLRHRAVQRVFIVDLDAHVVAACRRHLAHLQRGVLEDPRVTVVISDARDFLRNPGLAFDVIVVDLVDLMPSTLALFEEVFTLARQALREGGLVVTHGPDPGPPLHEGLYMVAFTLAHFAHTVWYKAFISSFGETWTFVIGSDDVNVAERPPSWWEAMTQELDKPPRSFVPSALPALFLHPPDEEHMVALISERGVQSLPRLGAWRTAVLDASTINEWQRVFASEEDTSSATAPRVSD